MAISRQYFPVQVFPSRIHRIDQLVLPLSVPAFDLLFPLDGGPDIGSFFKIYQFMNTIPGSKAVRVQVMLVFIHTLEQIIRYAGVDCGIRRIG